MFQITCPECIKKAEGFLLKAGLSADCLNWTQDSLSEWIVARDTTVVLNDTWRQERLHHKRPAIWRPDHRIKLYYSDNRDAIHLTVINFDQSKSIPVLWCASPEVFALAGPGAEAQIIADAEAVAARDAKEHYAAFEAARLEAQKTETDMISKQLQTAFAALGYDVSTLAHFYNRRASGISISPDEAAKIVAALGGIAPSQPVDPMPVWSVRYGENPDDDDSPLLIGARTEAAVRAHVLGKYYEKGHEDDSHVPLDPAKLHIELSPVPSKPSDSDAS
jgi:hypothetical protein